MPDQIHVLSLGAGVQSSTMALMAACGELTPMPTAAIFADTQSEPASVYDWLSWLEEHLPYPVYRVTKGSLEDDETRIRTSAKSGKRYMKGSIPAFLLRETGSVGILGRKCTEDYKIVPIQRKTRELMGIARATKSTTPAVMWIGISTDELQRAKPSRVKYIEHIWPLLEKRISRQQCLHWMRQHGFPEPPRSACVFCPFHNNDEWKRLKESEPSEFKRAVNFEKRIHTAFGQQEVLRRMPYLHRDCVPLEQIDFNTVAPGQQEFNWSDECAGMCGV